MRRLLAGLGVVLLIAAMLPRQAGAHAFRPGLLDLTAIEPPGRFEVLWKLPARVVDGAPAYQLGMESVSPQLPEHCERVGPVRSAVLPDGVATRWQVDCGSGGLRGHVVGVSGLGEARADVLLRFTGRDRDTSTVVLSTDEPSHLLAVESPRERFGGSFLRTTATYVGLGVVHILNGSDHLLFVLGLLLLVTNRRRLILTITAFTLAHSVTLGLAVLGFVDVPSQPVEATIALSVFFVAVELSRDGKPNHSWTRRYPWVVSMTFGLLHGFGFAGALTEVGLPTEQIPEALFGFNLGVELGQLAFVVTVLSLAAVGRRLWTPWPGVVTRLAAYAIGALSAAWILERVSGFWEGLT